MLRRDDLMTWALGIFVISTAITIASGSRPFGLISFVSGISFGTMLIIDSLK